MSPVDKSYTTVVMIAALSLVGVLPTPGTRASGLSADQAARSVPSTQVRLAEMRHHFAQVMLIHEAVIRGDLPSVREPAATLASMEIPVGLPAAAAPYVVAVREAGQRAVEAKTLTAAAAATVAMVVECANCHRAVGVFPAVPSGTTRDVGGLVGHMQEHQRAVDELLIGLMVPSLSQWTAGAERLRGANLRPGELPKDPQLTKWVREGDVRVHQLADQAVAAETPAQRAAAYAGLITTCAQCHGIHSKVWGPGRGGLRP
jgi:cytochrome c553